MAIVLNGTTGITAPDIDVTAQASDITTTGDITAVDATLSGGVYLGGTSSANYLDDYEEGTWTPTFASGSMATAITVNYATYLKIGKLVYLEAYVNFTGVSGNTVTTDAIRFSGLPFAESSSSTSHGSFWTSVNWNSGYRATGMAMASGSEILAGIEYTSSTVPRARGWSFAVTYETD